MMTKNDGMKNVSRFLFNVNERVFFNFTRF